MNANINFYDGLLNNDASSQRSRSENPNQTNNRGSMVGEMMGVSSGNTLQILNLKNHQKRSISNDNNNNNNKKSIQSINSSETAGSIVNPMLLKQAQDPNVKKRVAQRDYLKYSAFCQLGNNNNGEGSVIDDGNKSYHTQ